MMKEIENIAGISPVNFCITTEEIMNTFSTDFNLVMLKTILSHNLIRLLVHVITNRNVC